MANDLTKTARIVRTPEILAQAAVPYIPARPGYWTTQTTTVCAFETTSVVTTGLSQAAAYLAAGSGTGLSGVTIPPPKVTSTRSYVCRDVSVSVYTPATAGQAYRPAIGYRPASVEKDFNLGWNAGARSIDSLPGSGTASFQVPSAVGVIVGLNDVNAGADYSEVEHGIYASSARGFKVVESGVTAFEGGAFSPGDIFGIQRLGGKVTYLRNGTPIYASQVPSTGEVFLDAALYSGGDTVASPSLTVSNDGLIASSASMLPMTGISAQGDYAVSIGVMPPLAGAAGMLALARSHGALLPLSGVSSNKPYTGAHGVMAGMTGASYFGAPIPDYALSAGQMFPLSGASSVIVGGIARTESFMGWLGGLSSDKPYGESKGTMFPLIGQALGAGVVQGGRGTVRAMLPALTLRATGHDSTGENAFAGTLPALALSAFGGANAKISLPGLALNADATGTNWGEAALTLPALTLNATGTTGGIASTELVIRDAWQLVGYSGAVCAITIGGLTVQASGTTGAVGQARLTLPLFEMTASGTAQNYGSAALLLPALQMGGTAQAWLALPGFTLSAIGTAVVAATYEAYSINLSHAPGNPAPVDEVTRYTNFPFDRIVRYQGSYFGVAADGLYLLEGTTDDGVAIPYALKTGTDDFDTPQLKTVAAAYFGGRLGPSATVTLHAGETGAESYSYTTPRGQAAQSHREKFGRGVKSRYFALGLAGEDALALDSIEFETNTMKRRI